MTCLPRECVRKHNTAYSFLSAQLRVLEDAHLALQVSHKLFDVLTATFLARIWRFSRIFLFSLRVFVVNDFFRFLVEDSLGTVALHSEVSRVHFVNHSKERLGDIQSSISIFQLQLTSSDILVKLFLFESELFLFVILSKEVVTQSHR